MTEPSTEFIEIERMSVDQLAGAFVMIAGAIGSLLLVIWQSKCHCKMNLCYIFSCERRPPNEDEMKSLKDQAKKLKEKQEKKNNEPKVSGAEKNDETIGEVQEQKTPRLIPKTESSSEPEPEILDQP